MKLRNQILLALIPLIALPLGLIGSVAYQQVRAYATQTAAIQIESALDQTELLVKSRVAAMQANALSLAQNPVLQRYVLTEDELDRYTLVQPSLLRLLQSYQKVYPEYYEIRILLPDGTEDARSTLEPLPNLTEDEAQSAYFQAARQSPEDTFSSFTFNPDNDEPALIVVQRLDLVDRSTDALTRSPKTRGYLAITARLTRLLEHVNSIKIANRGQFFLVHSNGRVLVHADPEKTGEIYPAAGPLSDARGRAAEGDEQFYFRQLHGDIYGFAAVPQGELLAPSRRIGWLVGSATLLAILLTSAGVYWLLTRLVMGPISRLSNVAREIGHGNLLAPVKVSGAPEVEALAGAFQEMGNNLHRSTEQARYLAYHDTLTGLPNRTMFLEYLATALAGARRRGELLGLLFLDLDNFKQVNDSLGHSVGDELLITMADLLDHCLRSADVVGRVTGNNAKQVVSRLGGDEFTVLLPHLKESYDAGVVAQRILQQLAQPLEVVGHKLYVSVSIGITLFPSDASDAASLLKYADIAMYHAKRQGKNGFQYFSPLMDANATRRLDLERRLRDAVAREGLDLAYQPISDARSGELVGVEALLRWSEPDLGAIAPDEMIPIAEESGLILEIGEWVLRRACSQVRAWQQIAGRPISLSVNVSSVQVNRGDLPRVVEAALRDSGLPPELLQLEITESSILSSSEDTLEIFKQLRQQGVRISLDDFGTGYSSLGHLRNFPIDIIKIDRSFVSDIQEGGGNPAIIAAIIAMGQNLGMQITAEGIETSFQSGFLRERGCDFLQGFFISRPRPAAEIQAKLQAVPATRAQGGATTTAIPFPE